MKADPMLVIDSSAIVAMMLGEPDADALPRRIATEPLGGRLIINRCVEKPHCAFVRGEQSGYINKVDVSRPRQSRAAPAMLVPQRHFLSHSDIFS